MANSPHKVFVEEAEYGPGGATSAASQAAGKGLKAMFMQSSVAVKAAVAFVGLGALGGITAAIVILSSGNKDPKPVVDVEELVCPVKKYTEAADGNSDSLISFGGSTPTFNVVQQTDPNAKKEILYSAQTTAIITMPKPKGDQSNGQVATGLLMNDAFTKQMQDSLSETYCGTKAEAAKSGCLVLVTQISSSRRLNASGKELSRRLKDFTEDSETDNKKKSHLRQLSVEGVDLFFEIQIKNLSQEKALEIAQTTTNSFKIVLDKCKCDLIANAKNPNKVNVFETMQVSESDFRKVVKVQAVIAEVVDPKTSLQIDAEEIKKKPKYEEDEAAKKDSNLKTFSLAEVSTHNKKDSDCWIIVHNKVVDITGWVAHHPGGPSSFTCGEDLTEKFKMMHGDVDSLMERLDNLAKGKAILKGELSSEAAKAQEKEAVDEDAAKAGEEVQKKEQEAIISAAAAAVSYDFTKVTKKAHPGNGKEFKTLIYLELKGAADGAQMFANVKDQASIDLYCSKRPTLAAEYCKCDKQNAEDSKLCDKYSLTDKITALSNTDGYIAMTDLLASGAHGWKDLWDAGKLSVIPGIGRGDHKRSHFEVTDAAAKGVPTEKEKFTAHGWLAKSIFGYNTLYCTPEETQKSQSDPNLCVAKTNADYLKIRKEDEDKNGVKRLPDGISLSNSAVGPNAMEVTISDAIEITNESFNHVSGVKSAESVDKIKRYEYVNPFLDMGMNSMMGRQMSENQENQHDLEKISLEIRDLNTMSEDEAWAESKTNAGLEELLDKEASIFQGIGVLQSKLAEYKAGLDTACGKDQFPPIEEWSDEESDNEIGMQLRATAILMANGVKPKIFQLVQGKYDTHSNQLERMTTLLTDLKVGVFTFAKAAEKCGFWDDTLLTTFTDFGRRFEENSRKGTDHGWGSYYIAMGKDLTKRVYGYNPQSYDDQGNLLDNADPYALSVVVPNPADSYIKKKKTKGDMTKTTDLETWNACILDAMALPGLKRLGVCPDGLRIRDGLAKVPEFDENAYAVVGKAKDESKTVTVNADGDVITGDDDNSHLDEPLTRDEVLHVSRRMGFSVKSLGLEKYMEKANNTTMKITLKDVIKTALSEDNLKLPVSEAVPRVYYGFRVRKFGALALFNDEMREKKNVWEELLQLPYPRIDNIETRLKKFDLEKYFDLSKSDVKEDNAEFAEITLKNKYKNDAKTQWQMLMKLQEKSTVFHEPLVFDSKGGDVKKLINRQKDKTTGVETSSFNADKLSEISWYQTIMSVFHVRDVADLTVQDVIDGYKGAGDCDLSKFLDINKLSRTAYLKRDKDGYNLKHKYNKDDPAKHWKGKKEDAMWWKLKLCAKTEAKRKKWEQLRATNMKNAIQRDLFDLYISHFSNPQYGLRARMAFFYLNFYATPYDNVGDWLLMYKQYFNIFTGALGNYRKLAFLMFNDKALRKSLDQLEEVECGTAPIENFAREYFERFTVGLEGHNEGDVKKLSKGLMNCKNLPNADDADFNLPGVIFDDVKEDIWTLTKAEQTSVVDRVLDFRKDKSEPPAAAQFLCGKLYKEFGMTPKLKKDDKLSSLHYPPAVLTCASHLYDHNYDVKFALEHIFTDKENFKDTLGTKKRWPQDVIFGGMQYFEIKTLSRNQVTGFVKNVGMDFFKPQDVSGYDLDNVWDLSRISNAHNFLVANVLNQKVGKEFVVADFEGTRAEFEATAGVEKYKMADGTYSMAKLLCGDSMRTYVPEVGKEGLQVFNATEVFDAGLDKFKNKWDKFNHWRDGAALALSNVCQLVC